MSYSFLPGTLYALCGPDREQFIRSEGLLCPPDMDYVPEADVRSCMRLFAALYPSFDTAKFKRLLDALHLSAFARPTSESAAIRLNVALYLSISGRAVCFPDFLKVLSPEDKEPVTSVLFDDASENIRPLFLSADDAGGLRSLCERCVIVQNGKLLYDFAYDEQNAFFCQLVIRKDQVLPFPTGSVLATRPLGNLAEVDLALSEEQVSALLSASACTPASLHPLPLTQLVKDVYQGGDAHEA